ALHLLLAVLADRRSAAHRALVQSGVDLGRLRTAAMQLALGVVAARRPLATTLGRFRIDPAPASTPRPTSAPTGVAIPRLPPPHLRDRTSPPPTGPATPVAIAPQPPPASAPPLREHRAEPVAAPAHRTKQPEHGPPPNVPRRAAARRAQAYGARDLAR